MRNNAGAIPANGDGIKLWSDKSGNSGVNCLCLNGVNSNGATGTTASVFGTADFSVSIRLRASSLAAGMTLMQGGANSFALSVVITTGTIQSSLPGVAVNTASTGAITAFTDIVVTYVRSGTTGTYYINGVAAGTTTDSRNYSVASPLIGMASGGTAAFNGNIFWVHHYNVALTAPQVAADAAGTLQSGSTFNVDFSLATKLATSFTAVTGATVTINTTGDTGARISGERDLYQGTVSKQPILSIANAANKLTFDGSDDYLKAPAFSLSQPVTTYLVGQQISFTNNDVIYDGNSSTERFSLFQNTTTPNFSLGAIGSTTANTGWSLNTNAVITAKLEAGALASITRVNRGVTQTGTLTGTAVNGFTLAANTPGTNLSNITASEIAIYAAAHSTATQNAVIAYLGSKWHISV